MSENSSTTDRRESGCNEGLILSTKSPWNYDHMTEYGSLENNFTEDLHKDLAEVKGPRDGTVDGASKRKEIDELERIAPNYTTFPTIGFEMITYSTRSKKSRSKGLAILNTAEDTPLGSIWVTDSADLLQ